MRTNPNKYIYMIYIYIGFTDYNINYYIHKKTSVFLWNIYEQAALKEQFYWLLNAYKRDIVFYKFSIKLKV